MYGLKLTVVLRKGREEILLPALVSREVRPDSLEIGKWRLTVFSKDVKDGIFHVNFNVDGEPDFTKVQMAFVSGETLKTLRKLFDQSVEATTLSCRPPHWSNKLIDWLSSAVLIATTKLHKKTLPLSLIVVLS